MLTPLNEEIVLSTFETQLAQVIPVIWRAILLVPHPSSRSVAASAPSTLLCAFGSGGKRSQSSPLSSRQSDLQREDLEERAIVFVSTRSPPCSYHSILAKSQALAGYLDCDCSLQPSQHSLVLHRSSSFFFQLLSMYEPCSLFLSSSIPSPSSTFPPLPHRFLHSRKVIEAFQPSS